MTFLAYFGHMNIDITISVENIATKGSAAATGLRRQFGGTLGNFSMVASSLGLDFSPYSAVSQNSHSEFLKLLGERGLDTSTITVENSGDGPVCYIISDRREQNAYMFQGPMDTWRPEKTFDGRNYEYLHFSSGPPESYLSISSHSKSKRVFDPSQELFYKYSDGQVKQFLQYADIIMGNRQEVETILRIGCTTLDSSENGFDIIMTDGQNGTIAVIGGTVHRIRGVRAEKIADTIGAGDAFRAGFYSALNHGKDMVEAVAAGNITASIAISRPIVEFNTPWSTIESALSELSGTLID